MDDVHAGAVVMAKLRAGEDLNGGPGDRDLAFAHEQEVIAVLGDEGQVVHGRQHREAEPAPERVDELQDLLLVSDVERRRGLVEEQQTRLLGEAPRQTRRVGARRPTVSLVVARRGA